MWGVCQCRMYFFSLKNCTRRLDRTGASFLAFHLVCCALVELQNMRRVHLRFLLLRMRELVEFCHKVIHSPSQTFFPLHHCLYLLLHLNLGSPRNDAQGTVGDGRERELLDVSGTSRRSDTVHQGVPASVSFTITRTPDTNVQG